MKRKKNGMAQVRDIRDMFANRRGAMRPFLSDDGKAYILVHTGGDKNDPKNYRTEPVANATLRYDEWRTLDQAVIRVAEQRLVGFEDLRRNGLVYNLGNAMGTTILTWEKMSDAFTAKISIDPVSRGKNDRLDFIPAHTPIPVIHEDYQLSERVLSESRNRGNGLDTLSAERAARAVAVKLEDMLFGETASFAYGGGTVHSYLSHPDINTVALGDPWDDSAASPEEIVGDILNMKQASINDNYRGPWMLYVPTAYDTVLDEDYKTTGAGMSQTIRQRILQISGIQGITVVDRLPANNVLLVCMQKDVVDLIDGMSMQNIQWDSEGGMVHNYKVMAIQIPRIKSDYNGRSGIVLLS